MARTETSAIGEAQLMHNLPKVILDTDIGDDIDDSFALLLLLESKAFDVLGVTTVFRNAEKRAYMAKELIDSLGYDVKVYPGEDFPIKSKIEDLIDPKIKAKEKLDEKGKYLIPQWSESMRNHKIEQENAVNFIIEQVNKYPGEVTLITIGPMTNVARALEKDPSIENKIKEVRIMGGGIGLSWPEWNVFCDPEAAHKIYYSNIKTITQVGCNVTLQTGLSPQDVEDLKNNKSKTIALVYDAMMKWFKHYEFTTPVMHDPLTVASLLKPEILTIEKMHVEIDLAKRGIMSQVNDGGAYVNVATAVDKNGFFALFKKVLNI